jgi:hypothetical protein
MMKRLSLGLCAVIFSLLFFSCNPLGLPLPQGAVDMPTIQHVPYTGSFSYTVDAGSGPKDVYFVFTNPSTSLNAAAGLEVSPGIITVDGAELPAPSPQPLFAMNSDPRTIKDRISEFSRNPVVARAGLPGLIRPLFDISGAPAENDTVGTSDIFYTDVGAPPTYAGVGPVNATCRLIRKQVDLGGGRIRSLSIWVDAANWDMDEANQTAMTPLKIQALADKFLKSPASPNDIYHWSTAAIGEPWQAASPLTDFIPWDTYSTITILLCNLNASYTGNSFVLGYYHPKDNYAVGPVPASNQRIMFYLDATLFGRLSGAETTWSAGNYWPEHIISTLTHEFQHMIGFYQKTVLQNNGLVGPDAWITEMCSMVMEDLVADKLGNEGPRGVAASDPSAGSPGNRNGRIPEFNYYTFVPLAIASGFTEAEYYAVTYSFGSWLARNYGGAELIRSIVQSADTDQSAVINAIAAVTGKQETLKSLMDKWSASVLISDSLTAPFGYRYNTGGWFTSSSGGLSYNLGSINFFNYYQASTNILGPYAITETSSLPYGVPYFSTNLYYLAGSAQSGSRTWNITLPAGIAMSVVAK